MSDNPLMPLIADKHVLSIGAGTGLAEIYLVKTCHPKLMACLDKNVFARAAIELNAAANDVNIGDVLITISHPDLLESVSEDMTSYRLYDTVITADCLHGKEGVRRREVEDIVKVLKALNCDGADVVIADRNTAEGERRSGNLMRASIYEAAQVACGLTSETLIAQKDIPIPRADLERIGVSFGDCAVESVGLYHWPSKRAEQPLPRLNCAWWKIAASN